jgi:protein-S-isoprenylcysteine O-methyltransferase Ste14
MKALELKIPPALLALIFGAGMWAIDQLLPQFKQNWLWHNTAAQLVFGLAVVLIVAGIISFRMAKTTVDPTHPEKATTIVNTGVYKFTRNPMYLGFLLGLLAFVLNLANPITLIFLPMFLLYMNQFQIKPEERALTALFGESYLQYCKTVRRWI